MNVLDIGLAGLWVAVVAQTAFVVIYTFANPWGRGGFVGRALFTKSVVVWILLVNVLVKRYAPYPHEHEWGALLMWLLTFAIIYQLAALVDARWADRRRRQP